MMIAIKAKSYSIYYLLVRLNLPSYVETPLPFGLTSEEDWLKKLVDAERSYFRLEGNELALMLMAAVRMKNKEGFMAVLERGDLSNLNPAITDQLVSGVSQLGWSSLLRGIGAAVECDGCVPGLCKPKAMANIAAMVYLAGTRRLNYNRFYECCLQEYGRGFHRCVMERVAHKALPRQLLDILSWVKPGKGHDSPQPPFSALRHMLGRLLESDIIRYQQVKCYIK